MSFANPAFSEDAFAGTSAESRGRSAVMTVPGAAIKAIGLLAIVMVCAAWSWAQVSRGTLTQGLMVGAGLVGFVVGLVTIFKASWSPVTAPIYAAAEGIFLGALSNMIDARFGRTGIPFQAVALTCGTLFLMLFLYSTGLIKVTGRLVAGIAAATTAVFLVIVAQMLLGMFGYHIPAIYDSGPIGIGFSLIVVGIAAFNLLIDFSVIEQGAANGKPRYMEWYSAFGLMVTLVWLYIRILDLLTKLQRRN